MFHDGRKSSLYVLKGVGITPGYYTTEMCATLNTRRWRRAIYRSTDASKKRRKILRAQKKRKGDANKKKEGAIYKPGGF